MHTHTFRFSNNEFTALAHLKNKVPFVVTGHDVIRLDYMGLPALLFDEIYRSTIGRLIFKLADRAIALTPSNAEEYNKYIGVPYEKIRIVPNGIDYNHFQNLPDGTELKESIGNPEDVVLFIGRFLQYKNPDKLILAFREIIKDFPDTRLVMIGKNYGFLNYCKKLVNKFHLDQKVVFFENADEKIKLQALNIATVGVVPSEYEGFGFVALELQASGIPTIVNNSGGLKHVLINGETGLHLSEPTPTEIAKKVKYLLENDTLRKKMIKNAKEFGKKFSWDEITKKLESVYEEVLE
jgi:glycosyltransferase involved in cell wall biosynthesis